MSKVHAHTSGDNGSIWFWDWKSGHNFQQTQTIVQPGTVQIFFPNISYFVNQLLTAESG